MTFTLEELDAAAALVRGQMAPTPQYHWPLLSRRSGAEVWVKHENHGPVGAFKLRGGITFIDWLRRTHPECPGIITATRGNHGQSQARAATAAGLRAVVYVPKGNSVEKNAAMRALGADLREFGNDFDAARDALGLGTEVIGVVAANAATAKLSVEAGTLIATETAHTFADGMAVRVPVRDAFEIYSEGAARILAVSETEIAEAMRHYFTDTHNLAEGAGSAPLAALMQERGAMAGKRVGLILSGGNIDTGWFTTVLQGGVPRV